MSKIPKSAYHQELGRLGAGLKYYRPKRNLHSLINRLVTEDVLAFPRMATIVQNKKFPDVSFYQGSIDWDVMRSKTDTVVIRAGQNTWADSMFQTNYQAAKARGMLRGVYFFYDDRASPGAQADTLITLIADDLPEMEIWCDWENSYGGAFGGLKNVVAFMQRVEQTFPSARVGMYTGYYWFLEHSNAVTNYSQYQYLKERTLWLGYYANAIQVRIPAPWTALTVWQYGTPPEGHEYGVATYEIDLNFFNGTTDEFYLRYGAAETPPDDGGTMTQIIQGEALGNVTRRKTPAGETFTPARFLFPGDKIEASQNQYQWLKLSKINGVPVVGEEWASAGTLQQYIKWEWVNVAEPDPPDAPTITLKHTIDVYSDGSLKIDGNPVP
jgi:GH25 family lysozyme M1 (1,4-beta-N-acetylmuramidase)